MQPYSQSKHSTIYHGDCRAILRSLPDASVDCVISDPIYPCIKRDYGTLTEGEWFGLMQVVVPECMRVLRPHGSAAFVLQPNYDKIGRMRTWLWRFMVWVGEEWGIVQDAYWWNFACLPGAGCHRTQGLMRKSVKTVVWIGPPDCYRNQDAVLLTESEANRIQRAAGREDISYSPSGYSRNRKTVSSVAEVRGGTTPFNLLPIANTNSRDSAGAHGHGAGTPVEWCDWWVRYLCPPPGLVLDPFFGTGSVGRAAIQRGCRVIGIEQHERYCEIARGLLQEEEAAAERALETYGPALPGLLEECGSVQLELGGVGL